MIQNDSLKKALIEYAEEYFSRYDIPDDEEPHRFSFAYRLRRKNIERLAGKKGKASFLCRPHKSNAEAKAYMPLKKLAVTMSVVVSAVLLTAAAYFGARGFLFDVHNTHSNVSVDFSVYDIKDTIEEIYRLPKDSGYKLVSEVMDSTVNNFVYECNNMNVVLSQYTVFYVESMMVNTENSDISEIDINGDTGFVLTHREENSKNDILVMWIHDGYVLEIGGRGADKNELIRLAEMVQKE